MRQSDIASVGTDRIAQVAGAAWRNSEDGWGRLSQLLHWATALLILATVPLGWLANSMPRGPAARALFDVHFALGALIFITVLARICWRLVGQTPKPLSSPGRLVTLAAKVTHLLIYAMLLTAIASGYIIQVHMQPTLDLFGLAEIPRPFVPGEDESLRAFAWYVHNYTVWALMGLVFIHSAAALWHHFALRDQTLRRMLPQIRSDRRTTGAGADAERTFG